MALSRIILIDDNKVRTQQFENILAFLDYQVSSVNSSKYDLLLNSLENISAIFIGNGCDKQAKLIKNVTDKASGLPIFLLIEKGGLSQIPTAIQKLVTECHEWPSYYLVFNPLLQKLLTPKKPAKTLKNRSANKGLTGKSEAIDKIRTLIDQVADSDATVLILGESGTGKEVVAQALHRNSGRKSKPFVPINCGAIPGELLESELFGHEKGAFTGALTSRQGRFEMAEGGTLFLDEIGDMPMPMQVKLLRVLQERTFERVGSNKTIECNVRIITATHRNLEMEIVEKRFREDLFYRLNVFPIELPALRQRSEDIPLLVNELIASMDLAKRELVQFTKEALALMMQHPWPGNVRELSNFIERLAITNPNSIIDFSDLPEKFQKYHVPEDLIIENIAQDELNIAPNILDHEQGNGDAESILAVSLLPEHGMNLKKYLSSLEINLINQALKECDGVVAHAAKLLNMRRTTLVEKLKKYEIS